MMIILYHCFFFFLSQFALVSSIMREIYSTFILHYVCRFFFINMCAINIKKKLSQICMQIFSANLFSSGLEEPHTQYGVQSESKKTNKNTASHPN